MGARIGYTRVSSIGQNDERQLSGIQLDRVFADVASGGSLSRIAFAEMMRYLRQGDILFVHSMDRLARNLLDLRMTVEELTVKGVEVRFINEGLTFSPSVSSSGSTLMLSILGAFAEFERALIRERQREGIALAKSRKVYKGRKRSLSNDQVRELATRLNEGESKSALARHFKVSRQTLYSYIKRIGN